MKGLNFHSTGLYATFALGFALAAAPLMAQQQHDKDQSQRGTEDKGTQSVTGCVMQGSDQDHFMLKSSTGQAYMLMSNKVNLKPHVGHEVTVTGMAGSTSESNGAASTRKGGAAENQRAFMVTDLKMVSTKCNGQ